MDIALKLLTFLLQLIFHTLSLIKHSTENTVFIMLRSDFEPLMKVIIRDLFRGVYFHTFHTSLAKRFFFVGLIIFIQKEINKCDMFSSLV